MPTQKITITATDLNSPKVESRLKQQEALAAAHKQSQTQAPSLLDQRQQEIGTPLWRNSIFVLVVAGFVGGLLAWGCGEMKYRFMPDVRSEARSLMRELNAEVNAFQRGNLTSEQFDATIKDLKERGADNDYFQIYIGNLAPDIQQQRLHELENRDHIRAVIAQLLYYGLCGMMIAMALAAAEPLSAANYQAALINGAVGAAVGLGGGIVVSLFADHLFQWIANTQPGREITLGRQILARMSSWGVLGLFLATAPGLVVRNRKRLLMGMAGGLIGGLIGGALFDPIGRMTQGQFSQDDTISRLIAMVAIGTVAGAATGLIEHAARAGWMKVIEGLIAGKQFILYRNPTFIGSSPHCQIYLFRDAQIGRRHAAIHIQPNGYVIEDLGSGTPTMVNGRVVGKSRLKHGDRVQVGATTFAFREKAKTA